MRWYHGILFVVWALALIGTGWAAAGEIEQGRLPDAALISSYAGFAGICLFISVRRVLRRENLGNQGTRPVMRVAMVLLYATWLAAALSLFLVAQREFDQFEKYDGANVLRGVGGLMIVVWCLAPTRFRFKHADGWDYPTRSTTGAGSERVDRFPFKLGCGLILVPLVTILVAWFIGLLLWTF